MTMTRDLEAAAAEAQRGNFAAATKLCRRVLSQDAQQPDALYFLGRMLRDSGQPGEAIAFLDRAARARPGDPGVHYFRAMALIDLGRLAEAVDALRAACRLDPTNPGLHADLGGVLGRLQRFPEAAASLETALALDRNNTRVLAQLAIAYNALDRFTDAAAVARRALGFAPRDVRALLALGTAEAALGDLAAAASAYEAALASAPDAPPALLGLGTTRARQGRLPEAIALAERLIALTPRDPAALAFHGNALLWSGATDAAIARFAAARDLPGQSERACAGHGSAIVGALVYDDRQDAASLAAAHRDWDARHGAPLRALWRPHANDRAPEAGRPGHRRLRIGYVSPDFRMHSVATFFAPVLEARDRAAFEAVCYSEWPAPDDVTARIRDAADLWRPIHGRDDDALAAQIRDDRIDILVDLAGHQLYNRLTLFARKPAPVQATWLGYASTTGLAAIDWRISDAVCDPPEEDALSAERVMRLPGFHAYVPLEAAPAVASPPSGPFTFGSFNYLGKISPTTLHLWARVLAGAPGSRLIIKSSMPADDAARAALATRFAAVGIAPERLAILPRAAALADHLALYGRIDLALDTTPYCGTTTTCEALWMGVPVLTLRGGRHAARVGASLLGRAGLDAFVAADADDYVARALAWAGRRDALAALRAGMRDRLRAAPLCDVAGFTRALEDGYRAMWRAWCAA